MDGTQESSYDCIIQDVIVIVLRLFRLVQDMIFFHLDPIHNLHLFYISS